MKKLLIAICVFALLLTGCGKEKDIEPNKGITYDGYSGPSDAVMTVNGETVSVDEFNYFLIMASYDLVSANNVLDSDRSEFWDKIDEKTGKSFKQDALDDAINRCKPYHIYRTQSKAEGIELSKDDLDTIDNNTNKMSQSYGEYMSKLQLKAGGLTPEVFKDINEMSQYSVRLFSKYTSELKGYSEEEINEYYKKNYARAKQILILTVNPENNEALSDDKKQEALSKIMEIKSRLDGGEAFDSLMAQYNQDPGYAQYPSGYTFADDGTYSKEFSKTAFSLNEGDVSDVVETEYGYAIIKREPLSDTDIPREPIEEKLTKDGFQAKIDKLCEDADVRLNKDVYDSVDVEKVLSDYINSQDEIMAKIKAEYERIYAEADKEKKE